VPWFVLTGAVRLGLSLTFLSDCTTVIDELGTMCKELIGAVLMH
jgi:hypothetical protein